LDKRTLPSNSNHLLEDLEIQINLVNSDNRTTSDLNHIMSNSFAFGGTNASLIVSR